MRAVTLQNHYNDLVTQFAKLILDTKNYQPPISLDLLLLLNMRMQLIADYYTLVNTALQRPLGATENARVDTIETSLTTNLALFEAAKLPK